MALAKDDTAAGRECRYAFTIGFNLYNKQLLKAWMFPMTATTIQFFVGGCLGLAWFAATRRKIVTDPDVLKNVFPLALVRHHPPSLPPFVFSPARPHARAVPPRRGVLDNLKSICSQARLARPQGGVWHACRCMCWRTR